ncbi:MAG: hypothetical protein CBD27_03875 [Rhodospirillaceae bacterium TMED167]|nr:hypothetical protein [Rhodospirillaceae bacterium]OUW28845.1 MAG: hypothetical protein CBD27_03875 [Rhodospirillaceae bacterium TMED167]
MLQGVVDLGSKKIIAGNLSLSKKSINSSRQRLWKKCKRDFWRISSKCSPLWKGLMRTERVPAGVRG